MAYFYLKTDRPIVFCANPRTASQATAQWFMDRGAIKEGDHHDQPDPDHLQALADRGREPFIVQTVRHHCDMLTSWWFFKTAMYDFDADMEVFFESIFSGEEPLLGCPRLYGKFQTNYILRYESLQYELENLVLVAGNSLGETPESIKLPRTTSPRSTGRGTQWFNVLPWAIHQKIQRIYAAEMEEMGYGGS